MYTKAYVYTKAYPYVWCICIVYMHCVHASCVCIVYMHAYAVCCQKGGKLKYTAAQVSKFVLARCAGMVVCRMRVFVMLHTSLHAHAHACGCLNAANRSLGLSLKTSLTLPRLRG